MCISILPPQAIKKTRLSAQQYCKYPLGTYLFCFANPALLSLVRPSVAKGSKASLGHARLHGIDGGKLIVANLYSSKHSPAAMRGVCQVLTEGVVACLPAIEALVAEEALHIVGVVDVWVEVESSFGELKEDVAC